MRTRRCSRLRLINDRLESLVGEGQASLVNRLDRAFHAEIFRACGNESLVWTIDKVKSSFPIYALWREPGRLVVSVAEHRALIEALEACDAEAAMRAQRAHLDNGLEATIAYLRHAAE